jgi:hypothetical protein
MTTKCIINRRNALSDEVPESKPTFAQLQKQAQEKKPSLNDIKIAPEEKAINSAHEKTPEIESHGAKCEVVDSKKMTSNAKGVAKTKKLDKKYRKTPVGQATTSIVRKPINFDRKEFSAHQMDSRQTQTVNSDLQKKEKQLDQHSSERDLPQKASDFQKKSFNNSYLSKEISSNRLSAQPNAEYIEIKNEIEDSLNRMRNIRKQQLCQTRGQIENDSNMNIKDYLISNHKNVPRICERIVEPNRFSVLEIAEKILESEVIQTLMGGVRASGPGQTDSESRQLGSYEKIYHHQKGPHFLSHDNHDALNYRPSFANPMSEMETSIFHRYFKTKLNTEDISDNSIINSDESFKEDAHFRTEYFGDEADGNRYGKLEKRSNVSSNISYGFMKSAIKR